MNAMSPDFYKIYIEDVELKKEVPDSIGSGSGEIVEDADLEIKEEECANTDEEFEHQNEDFDFTAEVKDEPCANSDDNMTKKLKLYPHTKGVLIERIQRLRKFNEKKAQKIKRLQEIFLKHKAKKEALKILLKKTIRRKKGKPKEVAHVNCDVFELRQGLQGSRASSSLFHKDLKAFAVSLKALSHKSYMFMREVFTPCLPGPKTVMRWGKMFNVMDDVDRQNNMEITAGESDG